MTAQNKLIVAFVGMAGSGKGTCTEYIANTYNAPVVHFGNMMYEELLRRGLDIVRDEAMVRQDMREAEGPAVFAKRAAQKAHDYFAEGTYHVVFDGLYSWSELTYLRETFGDQLVVIAVVLPRALRYQRIAKRKDARRQYTPAQVEARDISEIEGIEKGGPIAMADYYLLNDTTAEHLLAQLDQILKEVNF